MNLIDATPLGIGSGLPKPPSYQMMAGAGAVAPFMSTDKLNDALPFGPFTITEMLLLLTVPVTSAGFGIGFSP